MSLLTPCNFFYTFNMFSIDIKLYSKCCPPTKVGIKSLQLFPSTSIGVICTYYCGSFGSSINLSLSQYPLSNLTYMCVCGRSSIWQTIQLLINIKLISVPTKRLFSMQIIVASFHGLVLLSRQTIIFLIYDSLTLFSVFLMTQLSQGFCYVLHGFIGQHK